MLWQARLEQAAKRHGMATVRCLRVVEEHGQPAPSSDGQVAILRAIREADTARAEHMRTLQMFLDFMTPRQVPKACRPVLTGPV